MAEGPDPNDRKLGDGSVSHFQRTQLGKTDKYSYRAKPWMNEVSVLLNMRKCLAMDKLCIYQYLLPTCYQTNPKRY